MKKTGKILLCMVMAVVMTFSLCACNSGSQGGGSSTSKATVESFMNALCKLTFDEAMKYVDTEMENPLEGVESLDDMKNQLSEEMEMPEGMETLKDMVIEFFGSMLDKMINTISYEIGDCKEDGDTHTYKVTVSMADFSKLEDMESLVGEEIYGEIMGELFKIGLAGDVDNSEEAVKEVYTSLIEKLDEVITKAISECEKVNHEMELVVVNKEGKWLISAGEELEGLNTIFGKIRLPQ